ncbi:unnamed protein product [Amoebophrya sp. A25]|nr:unnamed protein product [Amoebophrya sp. A25]|eukprot:GSA25T00026967001.1
MRPAGLIAGKRVGQSSVCCSTMTSTREANKSGALIQMMFVRFLFLISALDVENLFQHAVPSSHYPQSRLGDTRFSSIVSNCARGGTLFAAATTPPPPLEYFGVPGVNPAGSVGIIAPVYEELQRKKNCNFRGICKDETCYCQPGYHGSTCGKETLSKRGTYALDEVALVAVGVCIWFCMLTFGFLQYQEYSKKAVERAMGYAV